VRFRCEGNCSKLLYEVDKRASILVSMVEPYEIDIERLARAFTQPTSQPHVLWEFPDVFLPSFYPIFNALQRMSLTLDLPFAEILAPSGTHLFPGRIDPPPYPQKPGSMFDLIMQGEHLEPSVSQTFDFTALATKSPLNEAQ
jgi:hypothetical protein